MESEEEEIPFVTAKEAINMQGPFRMHIWNYPRIAEIPPEKWHLFHNMLLREPKICWQIRQTEDISFIAQVIHDHQNINELNLDFYADLDSQLVETGLLAESIRANDQIHKLVLRKDHVLKVNLSAILRTTTFSRKLKKLRLVFEPEAREFQALAEALANPNLQAFRAHYEMDPKCWELITPILAHHPSIRRLNLEVSEYKDIRQILQNNEVLQTLKLSHCDDSIYRPKLASNGLIGGDDELSGGEDHLSGDYGEEEKNEELRAASMDKTKTTEALSKAKAMPEKKEEYNQKNDDEEDSEESDDEELIDLTAEQAEDLVSGLKSNSTLKFLSLMMGEEGHISVLLEALVHDQIKISTLHLNISGNLSVKSVDILSNSLRTNTKLTNLDIHSIETCQSLAEALKHNSTLKYLRIRCKGSDSEGIFALCETVKSTNSLTELNLSNSHLNSESFALISDMIVHNKSLKNLVLISVRLDDEGLSQISHALIQNKTLTHINLSTWPPSYGNEGLKSFAEMLAVNKTLRKIAINCDIDKQVDWHQATSTGAKSHPSSHRYYDVDENVELICDGLAKNTTVTVLHIKGYYESQLAQCEHKILKLLENNYALTTMFKSTAKESSLLNRNKRLQSAARFKVVILSHNIARSAHALSTLPRELWCVIMTHVTHPGVEPLDATINSIFNSYK